MYELLCGNFRAERCELNNVHEENRNSIVVVGYGILAFYQALRNSVGKDIIEDALLGCGAAVGRGGGAGLP